jgi:riboflavin kinase/FMN adenylyltransferase
VIIVNNLTEYSPVQPSVVTIGTFDGVHIGHRKILDRLIEDAKSLGLQSTLLTFFPHPRLVLQQDSGIKMLNSISEKIEILQSLGLDCLVIQPFTEEFSRLTATEYVRDILVNTMKAKKIIIGYDHRFGRNRTANIQDLIDFGLLYGFEVAEIPAQEIDDVSVSSTKIRNALAEGDLETANHYLGYPYMLSGTVKRGKGLGKTIGFPTANLEPDSEYKLIPAKGVYLVKVNVAGHLAFGMMNIGLNPTVDGHSLHLEVHVFDLNQNLYDQAIRVHLLERIRDEQKFESIDDLKFQLRLDLENCKKRLTQYR